MRGQTFSTIAFQEKFTDFIMGRRLPRSISFTEVHEVNSHVN